MYAYIRISLVQFRTRRTTLINRYAVTNAGMFPLYRSNRAMLLLYLITTQTYSISNGVGTFPTTIQIGCMIFTFLLCIHRSRNFLHCNTLLEPVYNIWSFKVLIFSILSKSTVKPIFEDMRMFLSFFCVFIYIYVFIYYAWSHIWHRNYD